MRLVTFALLICPILSACAGTLGQVLDPAISSDHLDEPNEPNKLKSMIGDRRLIRTHRVGTTLNPTDTYEVCAETQADAIRTRSPSSTFSITDRGALTDSYTETLTQTVQRQVVSDVVRHLHWNTCNARLNGWITSDQYYQELIAIRAAAFLALTRPVATETQQQSTQRTTGATTATPQGQSGGQQTGTPQTPPAQGNQ
jgi:hypothetical protein